MDFVAWTTELVRVIRETVPDAKAVRRGRSATNSYGDRTVTVVLERGTTYQATRRRSPSASREGAPR
jgi:hypothetical protein